MHHAYPSLLSPASPLRVHCLSITHPGREILARPLARNFGNATIASAGSRLCAFLSFCRACLWGGIFNMSEAQANRPHRKQKEKKAPTSGERNPKAFAYATPGRLAKQAARSHDVRQFNYLLHTMLTSYLRSKKSASMSRLLTAFRKRHRPSSSASSDLQAWEKPH